jgi:branched-chain amino acid transport system permease protein
MNTGIFSSRNLIGSGIFLIVLILLATLPQYGPVYSIILLTSILMYIILTISWTIFSGSTGYISLATAAFFGIGIYTSAMLGMNFPLPVVVIIGGLISSCLALLTGALTLRLRGIYFAIFTFGLVELIKHFILWYEIVLTGTRGRFVVVVDNTTIYYIMLAIFVVLIITAYLIRRSKYGIALQSIGDNEEAASHTGVNVTLLKVITFAISAFFIGAAGSAIAARWTYIDPYSAFSVLFSFMPVVMAIFGGMGHFFGPVLGAAVLAYFEELLLTKFPYYYLLIFGLLLVICILFLPNGLVGLIQNIWTNIRKWTSGEKNVVN